MHDEASLHMNESLGNCREAKGKTGDAKSEAKSAANKAESEGKGYNLSSLFQACSIPSSLKF